MCVCWLGERGQRVKEKRFKQHPPLPPPLARVLVIHLQPSLPSSSAAPGLLTGQSSK